MNIEKIKELNKKYGNSPFFQIVLRNYLKQTIRQEPICNSITKSKGVENV